MLWIWNILVFAGQQQARYQPQQQQFNLQQQPRVNAFQQQNQQAAGFNQQNLIKQPAGQAQQNVQQFNQVPIMQQKQPGMFRRIFFALKVLDHGLESNCHFSFTHNGTFKRVMFGVYWCDTNLMPIILGTVWRNQGIGLINCQSTH